jgi:hypothetical protein
MQKCEDSVAAIDATNTTTRSVTGPQASLIGSDKVRVGGRYQQAIGARSEKHYQRPATLRSTVLIGGAILGKRARQPVLYIAQSWGGFGKHKPLMDKVLEWRKRTSPKSPPEHLPPRIMTSKMLPNFGIRI